jgi:WD40 repeat protein
METFRVAMLSPILCLVALAATADQGPPRTDIYWDPLPEGMLQRLGTLQYRQETRVTAFAFAPDGRSFATVASTSQGSMVRLWQTTTGKEIFHDSVPTTNGQVVIAPDGKALAVACGCDLHLWDTGTGIKLRQFQGHPGGIGCLAWSRDGKTLAVGAGNSVRLLDAQTGKLLCIFDKHPARVTAVALSSDGLRLASTCQTRRAEAILCLWESATGKLLRQLDCGAILHRAFDYRSSAVFSADLSRVFWLADKEVHAWDTVTGKKLWTTSTRGSVALAADGKHLVIASDLEGTITYLDALTGKHLADLSGPHYRGQCTLGIDPTGKYLATAVAGHHHGLSCLRLWDLKSGGELTSAPALQGAITLAGPTADGKHVVTVALNGTVKFWESATGKLVKQLQAFRGDPSSVALSQDGKTLACLDQQGAFQLLDLPACKPRLALAGVGSTNIGRVALSPDGRILAMADLKKRNVLLRDGRSGEILCEIGTEPEDLQFTHDGRLLTLANGKFHLWNTAGGKKFWQSVNPFMNDLDPAFQYAGGIMYRAVAVSPDGWWLAASVSDARFSPTLRKLCVWEAVSGQMLLDIANLPHAVGVIAFAPDGLTLVTGGGMFGVGVNRSATYWDLGSGEMLGQVNGHSGSVTSVAFAPDERTVVTGDTDGTVIVWDAAALPRTRLPLPRKLTPGDLEVLWANLAGSDISKAYRAILTMSAGGQDSVAFLQSRLEQARGLSEAELQQAIADLNDERYAVRARASALLATQGDYAAQALRYKLQDNGITLEMRRRIELLLPKLERFTPPSPPELRALRALVVLERIGNAQARKLVEQLAGGSPQARLTRQAQAVLAWLDRSKG